MTLFYLQQYGDLFEVRFSTAGAANAWQGSVVLPPGLAAKDVVYGAGIGDVWQTPPTFINGRIDFVGGARSGFTGDGLLFQFVAVPQDGFGASGAGQAIRFDPSRTAAYAADGKATPLAVTLQPITVNAHLLSATATSLPAPTPPDPFTIAPVQEQGIFQGRPAIVFSATDRDAGIDHYEVQEHTEDGVIDWHPATSPYLVDPGTDSITVKAVDRTGAVRIESIAIHRPAAWSVGAVAGASGILIGIIIACAYFARKWLQRRSRSLPARSR